MVSNTEPPKPILSQVQDNSWYAMVKEWRTTTSIGGMLVIETRLFSDNIIRQMVPLIKVTGIVGKRHYLSQKYEVILNTYSPTMPLKFKFHDSDDALEFQMDLMGVVYQ
jgi:hypothetical protein